MIRKLSIRNYALIDTLDIDFYSGFSVVTGETGAGKSIILGALSLLLGQRADSKAVKSGASKAVIEGFFDISAYSLRSFFEYNDLEYDPENCILRREIQASGKSRAFINDTPVSLVQLKELGDQLVDIHSQHQNLLLGDGRFQMRVIDVLAHNGQLLNDYRKEYKKYKLLVEDLERLKVENENNRQEEDYIRFQLEQFQEIALVDGEQETLEQEQEMLTHAEEIKRELYALSGYFESEDIGGISLMKNILSGVRSLRRIYPGVEPLQNRLETLYIEFKDIAEDIETRLESVSVDPERLAQVEERLDTIYRLQQKHRVRSVAELLEVQQKLTTKLEMIDTSDEAISLLEQKIGGQKDILYRMAGELSQRRADEALRFSKMLVSAAIPLGMPNLRFEVCLRIKDDLDENGAEQVQFLFSANKNQSLQPVAEVASGGEISRLMLCIKSLIAGAVALPTIIFDEVDTGVSGEIADKMGVIMKNMACYMQVISITHLPQVASKGSFHYRVYKSDTDSDTVTRIDYLSENERVEEIARMLSGVKLTDAALSNARELLRK
ncbi:DNA repair protein RecN [uncultured Coprobacter sp.]|uniref:DNA repair protein RecN n=1 Tax=uncultured Coprobacter sp. TaxID=1720550 RepID=UPI002627585E|nr:DNA repair protein RecN [uncultured Coprobacter sp.]